MQHSLHTTSHAKTPCCSCIEYMPHPHTTLYIPVTIQLYAFPSPSPYDSMHPHPHTTLCIPIPIRLYASPSHPHTALYIPIRLYTFPSPYGSIHPYTAICIPIRLYTSPYGSTHSMHRGTGVCLRGLVYPHPASVLKGCMRCPSCISRGFVRVDAWGCLWLWDVSGCLGCTWMHG